MPKIESQIVMNNATMARLEGKGNYVADSGEHIRTASRYERLPGGAYARGTKFSTTQKETVKEFIHPWTIENNMLSLNLTICEKLFRVQATDPSVKMLWN